MIIILSSPCARSFNTISNSAISNSTIILICIAWTRNNFRDMYVHSERRNAIVGKGHFRGKDYVQDRTNRGVRSVATFITGKSSNPSEVRPLISTRPTQSSMRPYPVHFLILFLSLVSVFSFSLSYPLFFPLSSSSVPCRSGVLPVWFAPVERSEN